MMSLSSSATDMAPAHQSMSAYFNPIDTLTVQSENDTEFSKEITHKHWKSSDSILRCANRTCRKQFSLLERHHHCRRCGNVFCTECLKYRRKLNQLANIDPQGRPYKVCKTCYEEGQTAAGCQRDLTADFARLRTQGLQRRSDPKAGGGGRQPRKGGGWRGRVNLDQECDRLVEGFRRCVGKSELGRAMHEMRSMVSMPGWQKSSVWLVGGCYYMFDAA
ncbi:hypothetical protein ACOMHN_021439 [Nucella lapillus]